MGMNFFENTGEQLERGNNNKPSQSPPGTNNENKNEIDFKFKLRQRKSKIKTLSLFGFVFGIITAKCLVDLFVNNFDFNIFATINYWFQNVATTVLCMFVMLIVREGWKDKERNCNKLVVEIEESIGQKLKYISENNLSSEFQNHIFANNLKSKLEVYTNLLNYKLAKIENKIKKQQSKLTLKNKKAEWKGRNKQIEIEKNIKIIKLSAEKQFIEDKIASAKTDIPFVKIKYQSLNYATFTKGVQDSTKKQNSIDKLKGLQFDDTSRKMKLISQKGKTFLLIGLIMGLLASQLGFHQPTLEQIVSTLTMVLTMSLSIYSGISDGVNTIREDYSSTILQRLGFINDFLKSNENTGKNTPSTHELMVVPKT